MQLPHHHLACVLEQHHAVYAPRSHSLAITVLVNALQLDLSLTHEWSTYFQI